MLDFTLQGRVSFTASTLLSIIIIIIRITSNNINIDIGVKRIPEDGGGDRVVGPSVEEDDEVVSGPGVLVQVDLHLDPLQGRVHRLHLRDRVLWVQDLNDRHVDASKVGLRMKRLEQFPSNVFISP